MHNYHIVVDHAFVSWYINDVTSLGLLANNTFWVRGEESEAKFLKSGDHIEWVGHDYIALANRLNKILQPEDKVFLHWYDLPLADFVMNLISTAVVYNVHWGGELLEEPYLYHAKRNYAPKTLALIQNEVDNKIKEILRQRNFLKFPFFWIYKVRDAIRLHKTFKLKRESVQRLQYNINHPANTGDDRLAATLYNHPKLVPLAGFYDLNFDLASSTIAKTKFSKSNEPLNILLNNAAHYSGNHLDAIELLSKNVQFSQYRFHSPLSYSGSPYQITSIVKYGKEKLKESFIPITELMPREEYVEFLGSMDVLFMYQNISQGFGNIIAALTQGKPVFLRKINSLTEMLTNIGIKVYDADAISDELIARSIEEAKETAEENRLRLMHNFSRETRLRFLKELLERKN
jgi:hypothetical protein